MLIYKCSLCGREFKTEVDYNNHEKCHNIGDPSLVWIVCMYFDKEDKKWIFKEKAKCVTLIEFNDDVTELSFNDIIQWRTMSLDNKYSIRDAKKKLVNYVYNHYKRLQDSLPII